MSRLIKCENRHFYDADKWDNCPICGEAIVVKPINPEIGEEKTLRMGNNRGSARADIHELGKKGVPIAQEDDDATLPVQVMPVSSPPEMKKKEPEIQIPNSWNVENVKEEDDDKTISLSVSAQQEVCGWLVGLSGANRGKDYRMIAGKNFLGRSLTMDIVIEGDNEISRETHCSLIYDTRKNEYWAAAGLGSMTYLNGELLRGQARIHTGDIIGVGKNELMFVAFCEGDRTWKNI